MCYIVVYNVHNLVHLPDDVRKFGPLDSFSAFAFENFLRSLKRLVRSGRLPLQQIVHRLIESQHNLVRKPRQQANTCYPKMEHFAGPFVTAHDKQFRQLFWGNFFFSITKGNNVVKSHNSYFIVRNILSLQDSDDYLFVVQRFVVSSDFFEKPVKSSAIGIVKVFLTDLSPRYEEIRVSNVISKCFMIPCHNYFVIIPLVHMP